MPPVLTGGCLLISCLIPFIRFISRVVSVIISKDRGQDWIWHEQLTTTSPFCRSNPSIGAVKGLSTGTAVVVYDRGCAGCPRDIYYAYSQDGGASWDKENILVNTDDYERYNEIATSNYQGAIHVVYSTDYGFVYYLAADYSTPNSWTTPIIINEENCGFGDTSITVNQNYPTTKEASITWVDHRNENLDIYFDSLFDPNEPYIDFEKYVRDPDTGIWHEADSPEEAIDVSLDSDTAFKIEITNLGDNPVSNIAIEDEMEEYLEYIEAYPEPDYIYYEHPFYYFGWEDLGTLEPSETITIEISVTVRGSICSNYYNLAKYWVNGYQLGENEAYVHTYIKSREIKTPFLNFLENHPHIFPLLRRLFGFVLI